MVNPFALHLSFKCSVYSRILFVPVVTCSTRTPGRVTHLSLPALKGLEFLQLSGTHEWMFPHADAFFLVITKCRLSSSPSRTTYDSPKTNRLLIICTEQYSDLFRCDERLVLHCGLGRYESVSSQGSTPTATWGLPMSRVVAGSGCVHFYAFVRPLSCCSLVRFVAISFVVRSPSN